MIPKKVLQLRNYRKIIEPGFFTTICLLLALGVICYPATAFQAAQRGLQTWWEIVFPSLLPFFIIAELLMHLGFVAFLGAILEQAMRPIFNLPGCSGFIIAVSYLSGFPLCAILTSQLRRDYLCTKKEGERLIAFTSNASPLFMLGAVGIGMYGNPSLGPLIAIIHYLSNFLCGIVLKAFSGHKAPALSNSGKQNILLSAGKAFTASSQLKSKSFGKLLGETVHNASLTILTIGGFITFFSVLVGVLQAAGIFSLLLHLLTPLTSYFHLDQTLIQGIFFGFFEITIGINEISHSSSSLLAQLVAIEVLLAWNGLAIQAQITGMVIDSDLSTTPYFLTRLLQIPMAILITLLVSLLPLDELLAVTAFSGSRIAPLLWGGAIALLSILFFLVYGFGEYLFRITRKKIIIIR